jgi:hypothetical protein
MLAFTLLLLASGCEGGDSGVDPTATMTAQPAPSDTPVAVVEPTSTAEAGVDFVTLVCLDPPSPSIGREWQVSAPRGSPVVHPGEVVELGLRNKFGTAGEVYTATATVVLVGTPQHTSETAVEADAWGYVHYPTDFAGAEPVEPGLYTVLWSINNGFIACDGFQVEAS